MKRKGIPLVEATRREIDGKEGIFYKVYDDATINELVVVKNAIDKRMWELINRRMNE